MAKRTVKPADIRIGDTINVRYSYRDLVRTVQGRVRRRDRYSFGTEWLTENGYVLLTVYKSGDTDPANISEITLVDRQDATEAQLPIFDSESKV